MRNSWLNIVHVIDIEFFEREIDDKFLTVDQLKRQAEKALKDFALEAMDHPPSLRFFVFVGHPFEELLKQTESLKCDLLVLGSYGNSGQSDRVGTTAGRFVRKAPVPVLLVREKQRTPFRKIVACFDYSETSRRALEYAAELASAHKACLHLVHIVRDYPQACVGVYGELPSIPASYYEDQRLNAQHRLERVLTDVTVNDLNLDAKAIVLSGPSPAIRVRLRNSMLILRGIASPSCLWRCGADRG